MPSKPAVIASTQKYLNILAIRDGMVVLRDGGIRVILEVGSINFALKSEEEQNGMLYQYQQFLNSLKFPIQIVMQSRRLDLFSYLKMLKDLLEKQTNDLLRIQTEEYITYIERLLTKANIMDKKFYVVIPYFPSGIEKSTMIDKVLGAASKTNNVHFTKEKFIEYKEKLNERVNVTSSGLGSMGLRVHPLNTQETIEMLYSIYNPAEAMSERMTEVSNLESPIVKTDLPVQMTINNDVVSQENMIPLKAPIDQTNIATENTAIETIAIPNPVDQITQVAPVVAPLMNDISIPPTQEYIAVQPDIYTAPVDLQNIPVEQQIINIPVVMDNTQVTESIDSLQAAYPVQDNDQNYQNYQNYPNEVPIDPNNVPLNNNQG